ncbi:MAG: transporter substrate-binding domain-containing protein [Myxococcaceae bacterium]|jgi:membrane-bound lytic murein transglycosylase F|nr:transporter substrate-binding domain-containing protein [Myxococcaceae bacterium]MCA3010848.1 transporter substrate-binding domain-containing protein [Myxococcaceae bacterium]
MLALLVLGLCLAAPDGGSPQPPSPRLRVLVRNTGDGFLPPQANPEAHELELLEEFAERHRLTLERVVVERFDELVPALLEGRGDVIAAGLTVTTERQKRVAFTRPTVVVDELLVTRASDGGLPRGPEALAGATVDVPAGSAFVDSLEALKARGVALTVAPVEGAFPPDQLAFDVARGARRYTVVDSRRFSAITQYLPGLAAPFAIAEDRPLAFALRPADAALRSRLDAFLMERAFLDEAGPSLGDLDAVKRRGTLRLLTRNNAVTFYLHRGERRGFDYELAKLLAKSLGVRLEVVVAPSYDALVPMLNEGRGDLIAASLTVTPERERDVAFSTPYLFVEEVLVERAGPDAGAPLSSLEQLRGRRVAVRPSSSYAATLAPLAARHGFTVEPADEDGEVEDLIADVGTGALDLTVADSHFLAAELLTRADVRAGPALSAKRPIAFAVRHGAPKLLAAVDAFVKRTYRGLEYNVIKQRAFGNRRATLVAHTQDSAKTGSLSPYDGIIKKYSQQYGFDWRLMSAQAWRESQFDAKAISFAGARGLFQVMPATGRDLGFTRLFDADTGAHAGIKYMHWLLRRFEPALPLAERVRFSLAAYNAGFGRVEDARRLAVLLRLNPDVWEGNVERAMGLLARSRYARLVKGGFCRCQEPVDYVNVIENKYESFAQLVPE